ncbi:DUF4212 domain-containing protein [Algisphaera agarilytica]|uniref:Putative solute:sodium symporter small subunit n=1 Tax=Algisphaera agarilytica TaxID=1385975 RepID=A0A7X0LL93_9BACT|nr:DUF4212 domain-containing protein [Algisphaera agarilytica]MBB6430772.1 putative solute:sodium symporter small subunit [Algisphaera agarilytica]
MSDSADRVSQAKQRYWRRNVTLMVGLLAIWAFVGLGCGILFADKLNDLASVGGVPLGFWFAQQGSIITFVLLILVYAISMNRLDDKYHREIATGSDAAPPRSPDSAKPQAADTDAEGGDA